MSTPFFSEDTLTGSEYQQIIDILEKEVHILNDLEYHMIYEKIKNLIERKLDGEMLCVIHPFYRNKIKHFKNYRLILRQSSTNNREAKIFLLKKKTIVNQHS